jgi:predicted dehydrogenase
MKTLRGAIVGFGFIAERGHTPAYASQKTPLRIAAVVEPCEARHAAVRRAFPDARIYGDVAELLERERLDFVDVCTPPSEHAAIARRSFAAGLHVLCEKPLATTLVDAQAMADAARRARRVLYPGHSYRHAPVVQAVRGLLARGAIGAVRMATIDTYRTGHARGVPEWRPDWRREPRYSGGGILLDHGPHISYLAFEWMGGHPQAVTAWTWSVGGNVEDDVTCTLVFPQGIVRAHLTWNAAFRRVIYTLHGDRGAIRVEDDEVELVARGPSGETRSAKSLVASDWKDAGHGPWFEGVLDGFARAIEEGDHVGTEALDAVGGLRVVDAAFRSARAGGTPMPLASSFAGVPLEECA